MPNTWTPTNLAPEVSDVITPFICFSFSPVSPPHSWQREMGFLQLPSPHPLHRQNGAAPNPPASPVVGILCIPSKAPGNLSDLWGWGGSGLLQSRCLCWDLGSIIQLSWAVFLLSFPHSSYASQLPTQNSATAASKDDAKDFNCSLARNHPHPMGRGEPRVEAGGRRGDWGLKVQIWPLLVVASRKETLCWRCSP